VLRFLVWALSAALRSRAVLIAENVWLREHLGAMQRRHRQPRLHDGDRQFWICASRWFAGWRPPGPIETPATLMPLQHCFRLYDEEKIAPAAEPSACKYPKEPVNGFEVGSRLPALEHQ
jgi:hypothetical protein